jgi:hypothetical protein
MVTCIYCCQKTSVHSLKFHIDPCKERREREQLTMPEELRIPIDSSAVPELPTEDSDRQTYVAFNNAAEEAFQASMPRCPNCERSFFTGLFILTSRCFVRQLMLTIYRPLAQAPNNMQDEKGVQSNVA